MEILDVFGICAYGKNSEGTYSVYTIDPNTQTCGIEIARFDNAEDAETYAIDKNDDYEDWML